MAFTYYREATLSGGWHDACIGIQVNSQDIPNNRSNITIKLRVQERVNASSFNTGGADFRLYLDGVVKATTDTFDWRDMTTTWEDQISWTGNVTHESDGTLSVSLDAYIDTNVGAGTYSPTAVSVPLPTIPRGSIIGTPTLSILENAFSVPTTKYSGYDRLDILWGTTLIKRINNYISGASITFTEAELQTLYNARLDVSATLTFQLKTYTSTAYTTQIGSTSSKTDVGTFSINSTLATTPTFVYLESVFTSGVTKKISWYYDVLKLYVNNVLIKTVNGFTNGAAVTLTDEELLAGYNALKSTTPEMNPTISLKLDTYLASNLTHKVGSQSVVNYAITTRGTILRNIGGVWKNCIPYIKVAGVWQKCLVYGKIAGVWKRGV